jgi:hypothetical protein
MSVRAPFLDKTIGVRVTEADYARLQALADAEGQPVGEWCRKVLLGVAQSPAGRPIDPACETLGTSRLLQGVSNRHFWRRICFELALCSFPSPGQSQRWLLTVS